MSFVNHQKIHTTINGKDCGLITAEDLAMLDFEKIGEKEYHLLFNNKSFRILVESIDLETKQICVTCNHRRYLVSFEDKLDQMIESMGLDRGYDQAVSEIVAPMPGLVLDVSVEEGQIVEAGSPLVILEAMKMENVIKAPFHGVVEQIMISQGNKLEKGQKMIILQSGAIS